MEAEMRPMIAAVFSATVLVLAHAQAPSLSGEWKLTAEAMEGTTDDGGTWRLNAVSGTLTLDQKDTDVSGSWKGVMPNPWSLSGHHKNSGFELRTEWRELPITRNGLKSTERVRWIFRGTVTGDAASGTVSVETVKQEGRLQPFTARRTP
jgi:hypothetical protein